MRVNITFVIVRPLSFHNGCFPTGRAEHARSRLGRSTFAGGVDVPADDGDMRRTFHAGVAVGRAWGEGRVVMRARRNAKVFVRSSPLVARLD
jgi:hypothetical protein